MKNNCQTMKGILCYRGILEESCGKQFKKYGFNIFVISSG